MMVQKNNRFMIKADKSTQKDPENYDYSENSIMNQASKALE
jgi:hypothetical protein